MLWQTDEGQMLFPINPKCQIWTLFYTVTFAVGVKEQTY